MSPRRATAQIMHPPHLRRTGMIALLVGAWLTAVNQGPALLNGQLDGLAWLQIALNVLTPFVVANLGLLANTRQQS